MQLLLHSPTALAALTAWLEPWHHAVGTSAILSTILIYLHLAALLVAGGLALAADRATLGLDAWDVAACRRHLAERQTTHGVVMQALTVVLASGVVLLLADLTLLLAMPAFWLKMGLVLLLLGNAMRMRREEAAWQDDGGWDRLRWRAKVSVALWLATLLAGTALTAA